ncbi:hypothetical protein BH23ACT8_BH23ACT8_20330 [soil metagenome]|jgi:hypothetical protein
MSVGHGGARSGRRAPRLGHDERIAPYLTRLGRFRRIDPSKPRRPPKVARMLGAIGWAVLVEESLRRARLRSRTGDGMMGGP